MLVGNRFADRQAKTGAARMGSGAIHAVESIAHVRQVLGSNTLAVIRDRKGYGVGLPGCRENDAAVGGGVAQGIFQQVTEEAGQGVSIPPDGEVRGTRYEVRGTAR